MLANGGLVQITGSRTGEMPVSSGLGSLTSRRVGCGMSILADGLERGVINWVRPSGRVERDVIQPSAVRSPHILDCTFVSTLKRRPQFALKRWLSGEVLCVQEMKSVYHVNHLSSQLEIFKFSWQVNYRC